MRARRKIRDQNLSVIPYQGCLGGKFSLYCVPRKACKVGMSSLSTYFDRKSFMWIVPIKSIPQIMLMVQPIS